MKTTRVSSFVRAASLAVALLFFLATFARAQITVYAKFADGNGSWAGDFTRPDLSGIPAQGWVQLDSFSIRFENSVSITPGSGPTTGAVAFKKASLRKIVDRVSPTILASLASGTILRTDGSGVTSPLTIEFVQQGAAGPVVITRIELKAVYFTAQQPQGETGLDELREDIELIYGAVRVTAWPLNSNGTLGSPSSTSWNQLNNTPVFP